MPLNKSLKKVMVIGSGPIVIGQAAEFDYAGTQACRALKEEGLEVVLVNSNPATIMTDSAIADHVYIEPLTLEFVKRIIEKEKPDSILSTLGGIGADGLIRGAERHRIARQHTRGAKVVKRPAVRRCQLRLLRPAASRASEDVG